MKQIICGLLWLLTSCTREVPPIAGHIEHSSDNFTVVADGIDSAAVLALATALEDNRNRIMRDLAVTAMQRTRVIIQNADAWDAQWGESIGASGIGFQVKGLTGPDDDIYIYGPWARQNSGQALHTVTLHEFAHAVTRRTAIEHVAAMGGDTAAYIAGMSALGQRTRWLSETIAVYEAKQATDLNRYWDLWRGRYPSIADLNDPRSSRVYEIGYRLAEYLQLTFGQDVLPRLVQHDGDVHAALGVSEAELMRGWFAYVEDRYLLVKPRWFSRR